GRTSRTEVDPETGFTIGTDRPIQGEENGTSAPIQNSLLEATSKAEINTGQFLKIDTALLEATAPLLNLINSTVNATPPDATAGVIDLSFRAKVMDTMPILAMDNSIMNVNSGSFVSLANQTILSLAGDFLSLINGSVFNVNSANGFLVYASGNSAFTVTGALINFGGTGGNEVNVMNNLTSETINDVAFSFINGATNTQVTVNGTPIQNLGLGSVNLPNGGSLIQVDGPNATVDIQGS
ncbi:MAG: hypothetical protein VST67_05230, partial [Nitrospirota bacterium]|nr:hypothetical protein [Nitrospirota bacterium]